MMAAARKLPTARPLTCPERACEAPLDLPYLCNTCGTLLRPPPGISHFERFGIEPTLDVDLDDLETRYMKLSRKLHPDRMLGKARSVQSRALVLSSALNDSYQVLKDERSRAEHLLQLYGGPSAEQEKRTPQALLLEMLELHEEIEELEERPDPARAIELRALGSERMTACLAGVRELFGDQHCYPTREALSDIRELLNVAKYWVTFKAML